MPSIRPEFQITHSDEWISDGLTFATRMEAAFYAAATLMRSSGLFDVRLTEIEAPPTHAWANAIGALPLAGAEPQP